MTAIPVTPARCRGNKGPMDPLEDLFLRFRQSGDPDALAQVFDRAAPRLLALALHLCSNPADAEDALQAAFVTAIDRAHAFDPARPLQAWLAGILTMRCKQVHERRARRRECQLEEAASTAASPPAEAERRELIAVLRQRVERLPEEQRQVLLLQLQHGLSPVEIGEVLGVLPGTVRMRIHRGLQVLRRLLPAGLAAWLWAMFPGRGLAAVRQAVLAHAAIPSATMVAVGSALLMKRALVAVAVVLFVLLGWSFWPDALPSRPTAPAQPSPIVSAVLPSPPTLQRSDDVAAARSEVATAEPGSTASLVVHVVRAGDAIGVAQVGVAIEPDGEDPRFHARHGLTGDGGVIRFDALPAGNARVRLDRPRLDHGRIDHQAEVPVQLQAGTAVEVSCELPAGVTAQGRVIDPDGARVPFAELWLDLHDGLNLGSTVGTTDAFGEFALQDLPQSTYLSARHRDFAPSWAFPMNGQPLVLRLLARGATVRGTVIGPAGPAADALVTLDDLLASSDHYEPEGTHCLRWPRHQVRTDASGCFVAQGLAAGNVELRVRAPGMVPQAETVAVISGEITVLTVRLHAGVVVRGVVAEPSGVPVPGAGVFCTGMLPFDSASTRTAADGSFVLSALDPERLRLSVAARGHRSYQEVRRAEPGSAIEWNVTLEPQRELRGYLLDERRQPLAAWQVRATAADAPAATTDDEGWFQVTQHGEDPLELWLAQPQGKRWFRCDWLVELPQGRDFEVIVPAAALPSGFVHGRVLAQDGAAWSGFVEVRCRDGTAWAGQVHDGELRSGPLPVGDYRLTFTQSDGQSAGDPVVVHVEDARTTELGDLRLAATGRLKVRLRRSDGEPLRATYLFLHHGAREHEVPLADDGSGMAVLPAGEYEFHLIAGNARWMTGRLAIAPGATTEQDITAEPAVRRWVSFPVPLPRDWQQPKHTLCVLFDPSGAEYWRSDENGINQTPYRVKPAVWPGVWRLEMTTDDGRRYAGTFTVADLSESAVPLLVAVQPAR